MSADPARLSRLIGLGEARRARTRIRGASRFHPATEGAGVGALARVEVVRAVRNQGRAAVDRAHEVVERTELVRIDDQLLDTAALLPGENLRSLDAIHLAAAQRLGSDLTMLVS